MLFSEVIGQENIKTQLLKAVQQNRIAHAQLFSGKQGVGKLPLALAYAQYLCCENRSSTDSCGACPSCRKMAKLAHPDLHFVFPIVKVDKKTICDHFISDFREAVLADPYMSVTDWLSKIADEKQGMIYTEESNEIIRKLNFKTYEAPYKIMIIWMPEKMHNTCANKLLKILEEPSHDTVIIMVSDNPDMLLTTIRSRVQNINIPPIESIAITQSLKTDFSISDAEATHIAHLSLGSYSAAKGLIVQSEKDQWNLTQFIQLMRFAWQANYEALRTLTETIEKKGRESTKSFLTYTQYMIRENFIFNLQIPELNYMTEEEQDFSKKFSSFINERNVEKITEELQKAEQEIEQNVNRKVVLFDMALKFTTLLKK